MDVENTTPRRMRRRTSILPGTTFSSATSSNSCESSDPTLKHEHLENYIRAVEDEKQKWCNYESELKAEYAKLKRKPSDEDTVSDNYMDYLNEDEKNFLSKIEDIKGECNVCLNDIHSLKSGYMLLVMELRNQRKHLMQLLQKKREWCTKAQMDMATQF